MRNSPRSTMYCAAKSPRQERINTLVDTAIDKLKKAYPETFKEPKGLQRGFTTFRVNRMIKKLEKETEGHPSPEDVANVVLLGVMSPGIAGGIAITVQGFHQGNTFGIVDYNPHNDGNSMIENNNRETTYLGTSEGLFKNAMRNLLQTPLVPEDSLERAASRILSRTSILSTTSGSVNSAAPDQLGAKAPEQPSTAPTPKPPWMQTRRQ